MVKQIWLAQDGTITVGGTSITATVTDISISGGDRDIEIVRCFGSGTNAFVNEKPQELFEASITYVKGNANLTGYLLGGSDGVEPISYVGDQPRNGSFLNRALIYTWTDNTDVSGAQLRFTFASVYGVTKEMKSAVGDYLEETFAFKCLPKDFKEEYTSDRVTSALA